MRLDTIIRNLFGIAATILLLCLVLSLSSCRTQAVAGANRDSVRIEYRLDSIRIYEHDSIFTDRYRSHDTVWMTTERWSVRWRDREVQVHDSIYIDNTQTIVEREPYIPTFYRICTIGFIILLVYFLGKFALKVYLKIQSGGIL